MNTSPFGNLGDELDKLVGAAESLLREEAESAGDHVDAVRARAREALHRACGHLRAAQEELGSRARRVDQAVRAHPWESLATVGIAAFLLGMLVRRR